jgi:hypothetical protein
MELATLKISPEEASAKLAEYTGLLAEERTREDEAIAAGYRAAARGLPIIRLSKAIADGGFFSNRMPKIAVVRADAQECFAHWDGNDTLVFSDGTDRRNYGALVGEHTLRVPAERPAGILSPTRGAGYWSRARTVVPIVPPHCRPRLRRLKNLHILWEVEEWKRAVPPRDPALIRHIRGDLWSVLAAWDLTELERYVLSQR